MNRKEQTMTKMDGDSITHGYKGVTFQFCGDLNLTTLLEYTMSVMGGPSERKVLLLSSDMDQSIYVQQKLLEGDELFLRTLYEICSAPGAILGVEPWRHRPTVTFVLDQDTPLHTGTILDSPSDCSTERKTINSERAKEGIPPLEPISTKPTPPTEDLESLIEWLAGEEAYHQEWADHGDEGDLLAVKRYRRTIEAITRLKALNEAVNALGELQRQEPWKK